MSPYPDPRLPLQYSVPPHPAAKTTTRACAREAELVNLDRAASWGAVGCQHVETPVTMTEEEWCNAEPSWLLHLEHQAAAVCEEHAVTWREHGFELKRITEPWVNAC